MLTLPPLPDGNAGPLLVAYSGGLDSSVLLHTLAHDSAWRARGVRAVHVHHGLQAAADDWTAHCRRCCQDWNVPLTVVQVQVPRAAGLGLEAAARQARYDALAAQLRVGEVLVTAHHQDDQAETFLLRALRASGSEGLAAMSPWRGFRHGWHWRPLLVIARQQLLGYAQAHGLTWIEDASNANTDLDRNFLRHQILPLLQQRWPQASAAFARSAALSSESARLLAEEDSHALALAGTEDPQALSVPALLMLPRERRARVLRAWLSSLALPALPAAGVQKIESDLLAAAADSEAEFRWHGAMLRRWRDRLHAEPEQAPLPAQWQQAWDTLAPVTLPSGDALSWVCAQPWPRPLRLTARSGGERLRLPGRSHHHVLKKLLQEAGIPPWQRTRLPLVWDSDGELLAAGDRLLSARLDNWLREHAGELRWQRAPADTV
ncbi:MAG TPA: tRNA lysidine(34) synthetase TilS [Pseudoxanthomonas sp.]|nr:tRNA lysidine(34) synthetase TilS [Pseudoxanthomonas sp.]